MSLSDDPQRVNAFCGDDCASTGLFYSNPNGAYVPKLLWEEAGVRDAEQRPAVLDDQKEPPDTPDGRVCIHRAYAFPRVQINPDNSQVVITLDIDDPDSIQRYTERSMRLYPSFVVMHQTSGKLHANFVLESPVHRNVRSLGAPLQKLARVADQLTAYFGADRGYGGRICRNPVLHPADRSTFTHWYAMLPYTLDMISDAIPRVTSSYGERISGVGRNCDLFAAAVSEAHKPRWQPVFANDGWATSWLSWVVDTDSAMHNPYTLPSSEHRSIAKSAHRYAVRQFSHARFAEIQHQRGTKRWHGDFQYDYTSRDNLIVTLYRGDDGLTSHQIADLHDLTPRQVNRILQHKGVILTRDRRRQHILDLRAQGLSYRAIAAAVGVSLTTVTSALRGTPLPNIYTSQRGAQRGAKGYP